MDNLYFDYKEGILVIKRIVCSKIYNLYYLFFDWKIFYSKILIFEYWDIKYNGYVEVR